MKYFLIVAIILPLAFNVYRQSPKLYSTKGLLHLDNEFSIKKSRIEDFKIIEEYALPNIYNLISYPALAYENGVQGTVIVKIVLTKNDSLDFSFVKYQNKSLLEPVRFAINKTSKYIRFLGKDFEKPFEFYIPIIFELHEDTFEKDLKTNKAITIKGTWLTKERYYQHIQHYKAPIKKVHNQY